MSEGSPEGAGRTVGSATTAAAVDRATMAPAAEEGGPHGRGAAAAGAEGRGQREADDRAGAGLIAGPQTGTALSEGAEGPPVLGRGRPRYRGRFAGG